MSTSRIVGLHAYKGNNTGAFLQGLELDKRKAVLALSTSAKSTRDVMGREHANKSAMQSQNAKEAEESRQAGEKIAQQQSERLNSWRIPGTVWMRTDEVEAALDKVQGTPAKKEAIKGQIKFWKARSQVTDLAKANAKTPLQLKPMVSTGTDGAAKSSDALDAWKVTLAEILSGPHFKEMHQQMLSESTERVITAGPAAVLVDPEKLKDMCTAAMAVDEKQARESRSTLHNSNAEASRKRQEAAALEVLSPAERAAKLEGEKKKQQDAVAQKKAATADKKRKREGEKLEKEGKKRRKEGLQQGKEKEKEEQEQEQEKESEEKEKAEKEREKEQEQEKEEKEKEKEKKEKEQQLPRTKSPAGKPHKKRRSDGDGPQTKVAKHTKADVAQQTTRRGRTVRAPNKEIPDCAR